MIPHGNGTYIYEIYFDEHLAKTLTNFVKDINYAII
jgi:hypothetical protein